MPVLTGIMKTVKMGSIILGVFVFTGLTYAVQPVPRVARSDDDVETMLKVEKKAVDAKDDTRNLEKENDAGEKVFDRAKGKIKNVTDNNGDRIVDSDSNNVNDQRERDLLKIKQLGSKFKDLLNKNKDDKKDDPKKPNLPPKTRSNKVK